MMDLSVHRAVRAGACLLASLALLGCSTPKHTNVLIFGTNTKFAFDVSQDPTSGVGVTLGYKREEAVWMPLMPNEKTGPVDCKDVPSVDGKTGALRTCDKYVGTSGDDRDTYSVLASFGANVDGRATATDASAQAKGSIAQYFATGWAARALAQNGGAALVNNQELLPLTTAQRKSVATLGSIAEAERVTILVAVRDASDPSKIDQSKMAGLLAKATGPNSLSGPAAARFGAAGTAEKLRELMAIHDTDTAILAALAK